MKFSLIYIFLLTGLLTAVRASNDDGSEAENKDEDEVNDNDTSTNNDAETNESSTTNTPYTHKASYHPKTLKRNPRLNNSIANTNQNIATTRATFPLLEDRESIDPKTGLSVGTLRLLARISPCKRQLLLDHRRLLRSPTIRLQFYRDLYQRHQFEHVAAGCGEGDGRVKLGFKERAVLLGDPFFRAKVKKLMRGRQPIGVAINGPVRYPNDIVLDNTQPRQNILTITKQY